jgi:predicted AlkP superfamily pyrophosphatase or phosphodiesterase
MRYWELALVSAFVGDVAAKTFKHVAYFSIDGFHSSDVEKYVAVRPNSTIASLLSTGIEYTNAFTSAPSDSFPGTLNQFTGASPRTTGVWYDDVFDRAFFPPGSNCTGPPGAEGVSSPFQSCRALQN